MRQEIIETDATTTREDVSSRPPAPPRLDLAALRNIALEGGYRVGFLASYVGVSERHLQRIFVRELGCSPENWLREERLQVARRLLRSAGTVKEVALALSYSQLSQFSRDFRQRFGCSPSQWRGQSRG
jgi:AraC family transcriptional activator of tynA and feaB